MEAHSSEVFVIGLTVFFLACVIGYYVVWSVTPALPWVKWLLVFLLSSSSFFVVGVVVVQP